MTKNVEARLAALAAEVRRRQFADEGPIDGLSQSLEDFEKELLSLDDLGKATFLAELNQERQDGSGVIGLTPEALDKWIADIRESRKIIW